ncbi:MAG: ATP-dependent RNA helicase HrpA [Acidimicrobiales bacterium]
MTTPVPEIVYPPGLPISERKNEILAAIRDHQVVVVAGETGSGKSTQLPKICLELGRGRDGLIGHTQPRRLAARTVAERVADELGTEIGGTVGYAVRFTDKVGAATLVKVMTDGILLAEIPRDRLLLRYDTIIVDEAHERSLNVDFLLGYLKQLLPQRPDLKVIVTSATIDTERFSAHFGGAPVVEVSGRTYPVEMRYRPIVEEAADTGRDQVQAVCDAVAELRGEVRGDILVFLSGQREIRDTADALAALDLPATELLPLYARLSVAEQHRVFLPHPGRRVVLATNVAETSLTVPGIRYVVDAGTARISRYNRRTKVQRLPIEAVSQASANQRAGRCGRVAPGICIRLYDEEDLRGRPEFTEPEILRTNLASVILQMAALGLGEVAAFPFLDPPDGRAIADGVALLHELGALDMADDGATGATGAPRLTPLGRRLARLPLDPRLGRMVLESDAQGCVREVMVIAAGLSIQDPRERPAESRQAADEMHRRFADPDSDFLAYLKLWDHLREQQKALSSNQFRKLCRAGYLNHLRVREWQDIYSQLRQAAAGLGIRTHAEAGRSDAIHRSLLAGLLSHLGLRDGDSREYLGARQARFAVAPGSAVTAKPPRWVMAAELVETNRQWARVVARIQPEWAERAGAHLVARTYSEPRWDAGRGGAVADERVTLYGLPLVTGRTVNFGTVDPVAARELFITHALVGGRWETHHRFVRHNQDLIERVRDLEQRARRPLLVDEQSLFAFFDDRIGPDVVSARHFDSWWKVESSRRPALLDFTLDRLIDTAAGAVRPDDHPDEWRQSQLRLRLSYRFSPGEDDDGVTVHIPLLVLNQVTAAGFDWQVHGQRLELVTALLRMVPKQLRRQIVPLGEYAGRFLEQSGPADGPLVAVLGRQVARSVGSRADDGDLQIHLVPAHLRMTFSVEDDAGRAVATGKDLEVLRARLQPQVRTAVADAAGPLGSEGSRIWSFGTLARTLEVDRAGHCIRVYPAVVDEGDSVVVQAMASRADQARAMWGGTRRLLLLNLMSPVASLLRRTSRGALATLARGPYVSVEALMADCVECAIDDLVVRHGGPPWDEGGFAALLASVKDDLADTVDTTVTAVVAVLDARRRIEERLDGLSAPVFQASVDDIAGQLARLVQPGFIATVGTDRLADIGRYTAAIEHRLDTLAGAVARDQQRMQALHRLEEDYRRLLAGVAVPDRTYGLLQVRWMLEELRVSVFAQKLGTPGPVSEPRIRRAMEDWTGGR